MSNNTDTKSSEIKPPEPPRTPRTARAFECEQRITVAAAGLFQHVTVTTRAWRTDRDPPRVETIIDLGRLDGGRFEPGPAAALRKALDAALSTVGALEELARAEVMK